MGDVWHGLMGADYAEPLMNLMKSCLENPEVTGERFGDAALLVDRTHAIPLRLLSSIGEKRLMFQTIIPQFDTESDAVLFTVEEIDEWANGLEATFKGTIFEGHWFSFYCQNYLEHKNAGLQNKKVNINLSVVARGSEVLPKENRVVIPDSGPFQGKEFYLDNLRYLNPQTNGDPELCEFCFPIQEIQTIRFLGSDVYKIKGVLTDTSDDKDYFYNVYTHPSHVKDAPSLALGEPFHGWGWLQASIAGVVSS